MDLHDANFVRVFEEEWEHLKKEADFISMDTFNNEKALS